MLSRFVYIKYSNFYTIQYFALCTTQRFCLTNVNERVVDGDRDCRAQCIMDLDPHSDQLDRGGHVETG